MTSLLAGAVSLSLAVQQTGDFTVLQILAARPPPLTYSSSISLRTIRHTSGVNEQDFATYVASLGLWLLGCVQNKFGTEAKPFRSASKLWGLWMISSFVGPSASVELRTTCTGSVSKRRWRSGCIRFLVVFYRSHAGTKHQVTRSISQSLTAVKRILAFIHSSKKSANWQ